MNYAYPFLTLILLLFLQVAGAAPGSTMQRKDENRQQSIATAGKKTEKIRLPLAQRLVLNITAKKIQKQKQHARPAAAKDVKATGRYRYGAISLICLFVSLITLITPLSILAAFGVAGAVYFGFLGLKRDADPSLARVSLIALGILIGLVAILYLISLVRIVG